MMLNPNQYDNIEKLRVKISENRILEIINPIVFNSEGYVTRIHESEDAYKFVDVMQERRFEYIYNKHFNNFLTAEEYDLFIYMLKSVTNFISSTYNKKFTTISSLLISLHMFQQINSLFLNKKYSIFEFGPGSGYLGIFFNKNKIKYSSTDITQSFYIFQNHLYNYFESDFSEGVINSDKLDKCAINHYPWWEFYNLYNSENIPKVDVITCNHALAEMHPNALSYCIKLSYEMLKGEGDKYFIFEGWGFEKFINKNFVNRIFIQNGFELVHITDSIVIYMPDYAKNKSIVSYNFPIKKTLKRKLKENLQKLLDINVDDAYCYTPPGNFMVNDFFKNNLINKNRMSNNKNIKDTIFDICKENGINTDCICPDDNFLTYINKHY